MNDLLFWALYVVDAYFVGVIIGIIIGRDQNE